MSSFLTPLIGEYIDGHTWKLHEPFEFCLGALSGNERIIVEQGFETDFASIPKIFHNILPPTGRYGKAAVIHDKLYKDRKVLIVTSNYPELPPVEEVIGFRFVDRGEADRILNDGMRVLKVNWFTRFIVYRGVQIGGWVAWNSHRKAEG